MGTIAMTDSQHKYCFNVDRVVMTGSHHVMETMVMTGGHHGNNSDDLKSSWEQKW